MYESHFGFSGPPFQLNPDPGFYFESRGHAKALAYLRFGVQQGEGFIAITGDAGTGKTTLVRTLLQQLDEREVVAAQLSNTQLDAMQLLFTCLTAFGVRPQGASKAAAIASIEAFLTAVAASGRRALLVVDEAHNLSRAALEELRMLSNFQLGSHGLLQVFLVGQSQLRTRLQSAEMEQLRQRVIASCHLDAMDAAETRAYVLHRLRRVRWADRPAFDAAALGAIHAHTAGTPRRINLLCNRLLLAAYLGRCDTVSEALVEETAAELLREQRSPRGSGGDATPAARGTGSPLASRPPRVAPPDASTGGAAVMPLNPRVAASEAFDAGRAADRPSVTAAAAAQNRLTHAAGTLPQGAMLALCDGSAAEDEMRYLAERWGAQSELPPLARVILGTGQAQPVAQRMGGVAAPLRELPLGVQAGSSPRLHAERVLKFGTLLAEARPSALIVSGASHGLVQCVLTARELSIPVVRLGAGDRRGSRADDRAELAALLDRCADLLCVDSLAQRQLLAAEGFPARRIVRVRSLSFGVVQSLLPWLPTFDAQAPDSRLRLPPQWRAQAARGFGLVSAQLCVEDIDSEDALHWLMLARHAGDAMPWLWPVTAASAEVLARPVLRQQLDGSGIAIVPCEDRLERLAMLRAARCLLAGPARDLVDEAVAMDIPTIVVDLYADRSSVCDAGPVVQVGPSASQLKAALVGIEHAAQRGPTHAHAGEDPAMMVIEQIASWFAQRDTGSPGATSEEAAA